MKKNTLIRTINQIKHLQKWASMRTPLYQQQQIKRNITTNKNIINIIKSQNNIVRNYNKQIEKEEKEEEKERTEQKAEEEKQKEEEEDKQKEEEEYKEKKENIKHAIKWFIFFSIIGYAGVTIITSDEFLDVLVKQCVKEFINHPECLDFKLDELKIESASGCFTCGAMIWNNVNIKARYYEPLLQVKEGGEEGEVEYSGRYNIYDIEMDAPTMKVKLPLYDVVKYIWQRKEPSFEFDGMMLYGSTIKVTKVADNVETPEDMPNHLTYYNSRRMSSITAHELRIFDCNLIYEDEKTTYTWNVNRLQNLCSTKSFNLPFFLSFRSKSRSFLNIKSKETKESEKYVMVLDSVLDVNDAYLEHRWVISTPEVEDDETWYPKTTDEFLRHAQDDLFLAGVLIAEFQERDSVDLIYHDKENNMLETLTLPHEDIFHMGAQIDDYLNPLRKLAKKAPSSWW
mmetsp:Transcript_11195/g.16526  ORF Transcript_11195/g.16526 Transcript_11195/m.16526 type:complete len:455 (+) Transcript_11195:91-1455(+)